MKWYYVEKRIMDDSGKVLIELPEGLTPYWEIVIRAVNNYDNRRGKVC